MKAALSYLILTKLKNQVKSFLKSPGKIIYLVLLVGIIGLTIFSGKKSNVPGQTYQSLEVLAAGVTAFLTVMFLIMVYKGFGNGATMFSMADVSMIFTAPLKQHTVLFYGMFQQMGTSLLLGIFMLFQYSWMHSVFNVGYGVILLILLGYALTMFLAQLTAMVIYAFTSAYDGRKRVVKIVFYVLSAALVLYVVVPILIDQRDIFTKASAIINGPLVGLFPVSGWIGRAVEGILLGHPVDIAVGLLLGAAYLIGLVYLMTYGKQDYYEDVLKSSEIAQSAITARKEGRTGDVTPSRVKVGKIGIGRGFGASTFYYKHMLENRRSRVFILDTMSLIYGVMIIGLSFFLRRAGISSIFITATIFQVFTVALGRFNKELTKPYIYMTPEPPVKKMLFALADMLPSAALEAVVIFVPVALIMGASPLDAVLCIAARLSFAFLFTGVNVAVTRLWGGSSSKVLVMLLYFALLIVMSAPGIVLASILGFVMEGAGQNVTVFLSLIVCNIPIALLVLFLCRNMLQYAELNQQ